MAQDAIFSDINTNVDKRTTQAGLEVLAPCQFCQRQRRVMHSWDELRAMASGHPVPGVNPQPDGWIITVPCTATCTAPGGQRVSQISYKLRRREVLDILGL